MAKQKVGRPSVISPEIVSILIEAFGYGFNVSEACWRSGISRETYYQRLRSDEEFADKMVRAQNDITMTAKMNITTSIGRGDINLAKWWIERQDKLNKSEQDESNTNITI